MTINNWVTATGRILYLTTNFLRFGVTCIIAIEYIGLAFRAFVYNCGVQVKFEFRSSLCTCLLRSNFFFE